MVQNGTLNLMVYASLKKRSYGSFVYFRINNLFDDLFYFLFSLVIYFKKNN